MSSPELTSFDIDLLELLEDRKWEAAASQLYELAAKGGLILLHPRIVEALAYRLTKDGRKKRRSVPLTEELVLGGKIERAMQGTSPFEVFKAFVHSKPAFKDFVHSADPVPYGEGLTRLNDVADKMGISQSTAEKARAAYNRFLEVANQAPPEDPLNS